MCYDSKPVDDNRQISSSVKILTFHKLLPKFSFGSTNFSPKKFEKLLYFLIEKEYNFVSLKDAMSSPDERKVVIAFDDGYQHLAKYLPPFIEKFQLRPHIFIPTSFIGLSNKWDYSYLFQNMPHLDKDSIKHLSDLGVDFGSHGHSHYSLTSFNNQELNKELKTSKNILEDITGNEITTISYPFGRYNKRLKDFVKNAGYKYGFTMNFPASEDDHYALGRYTIYGYDSLFTINQKITGGKLYLLEKLKAKVTNKLSQGTILLNYLRGLRKDN